MHRFFKQLHVHSLNKSVSYSKFHKAVLLPVGKIAPV